MTLCCLWPVSRGGFGFLLSNESVTASRFLFQNYFGYLNQISVKASCAPIKNPFGNGGNGFETSTARSAAWLIKTSAQRLLLRLDRGREIKDIAAIDALGRIRPDRRKVRRHTFFRQGGRNAAHDGAM